MSIIEVSSDLNNKLTRVYVGPVVVWFSYTTPIAFHVPGQARVVSKNVWSNTTGRHLNAIDGGAKASRVSHDEFVKAYDLAMTKVQDALSRAFA